MHVQSLHVSNFRSFKQAHIDFDRFSVLIGANASGKSNIVRVFQFLNDAAKYGIDNAISQQGGLKHIRNIQIQDSEDVVVKIVLSIDHIMRPMRPVRNLAIRIKTATYELRIRSGSDERGYSVHESAVFDCEAVTKSDDGNSEIEEVLGEGTITFLNKNSTFDVVISGDLAEHINKEDVVLPDLYDQIADSPLKRESLFLRAGSIISPLLSSLWSFRFSIGIFDVDPQEAKVSSSAIGMAELEPDVRNLPIVLKNIIQNAAQKERLRRILQDFLPFVEDIMVDDLPDGSLLARMKESYCNGQALPAFLLSDGVIAITTLIITLFFEDHQLVIFEAPERNVHPKLISKIVGLFKDVSERLGKQIIVTTHNPEFVKYTPLENLILIRRNKEGYSTTERPAQNSDILIFLEHDLGIDELYVQGLL